MSFDARKTELLNKDASPKGSWDERLNDILQLINEQEDYFTTSSCSGRLSIYLDGKTGRKGGGSWLIVSHSPANFTDALESGALVEALAEADPNDTARMITLKFEPIIMHVCARTIGSATEFLGQAMACGFKESGIVLSKRHATAIVAVRTSLRLEIPIAVIEGGKLIRKVDPSYLYWLQDIVNERFKENNAKILRLEEAFKVHFGQDLQSGVM